ncbi:heterokaryon incompatibility protein-domain-containing protein, partial [Clohesyomyces aquaticus]
DDAAHQFIETRPLTTSRGSDENIGVIKSWLDDCQSNHAFCMQHANTKADLPTRLVEIIDLDTARLVETAGQVGEYVALSYCWGPNPDDNSMTTRSNLSERLQPHSLLRNELPGAIRDAIAIVERLGIRYIWIDAICMVQDDFNDKNFELGKMSQYYRNSYMTIAVSTTRCTTGFIGTLGRCEKHPKSPLPRDLIPLDVFALSMTKDEGQSGKVYVREENPYRLSEEPINKRAWTLQEGVLAPRVLLFGSRVIWFCQHMTHSDGGVEDWSFDETELERTRREFQVELSKLDREGSSKGAHASTATDANNTRDIYGLWHRIVGSYSRRDVSHPSDKLPAISAIAAEFSRLSNDDYLAGLWRSNLARDLLWRTPQPETHRPPQWRAPSWSWASVDDAIIYDEVPPPTATLLAEVLDVETVPLTTTVPFGEVSQGRLVISALSWRMKFSGDEDREHMSAPFLKAFGFNPGTSEREMLLEALKLYSRPEWKESEDEKKKFQLPDDFVVVLIYGLRDELAEFDDTDGDGETEGEGKTQLWTTWGLILKPTGVGEGDEELFERVMSFWQVPVRMEGPDPLPRRTLHII